MEKEYFIKNDKFRIALKYISLGIIVASIWTYMSIKMDIIRILTWGMGSEGKHNLVAGIVGGVIVIVSQHFLWNNNIKKFMGRWLIPSYIIIMWLFVGFIIRNFK